MPSPTIRKAPPPERFAERIRAGDRSSLARAITLIESRRDEDRDYAYETLRHLMPATGDSHRVAISGSPGVGKSTLIEVFGLRLVEEGRRIAVLAVDPSSSLSGGSILGDKSRMGGLARSEEAFIRPVRILWSTKATILQPGKTATHSAFNLGCCIIVHFLVCYIPSHPSHIS